jgi:hypothetical protein
MECLYATSSSLRGVLWMQLELLERLSWDHKFTTVRYMQFDATLEHLSDFERAHYAFYSKTVQTLTETMQ